MAGNQESGRKPVFSLSENELKREIDEYRKRSEIGDFRPSWPHFCATLGYTEEEIADVMKFAKNDGSAYKNRAILLKKQATWQRGQYMSSPGWQGQNTSKAIFALKQDVGDNIRYSDRETTSNNPVTVSVNFGGGDTRASRAPK